MLKAENALDTRLLDRGAESQLFSLYIERSLRVLRTLLLVAVLSVDVETRVREKEGKINTNRAIFE